MILAINPNIDARSQKVLDALYPPFAAICAKAADALADQHTWLCFFDGVRTADAQTRDYAQGRTAPGHIITNARPPQSYHCMGLAVDVVPYKSGKGGALNWTVTTPQYKAFVQAMKDAGADWGGGWVSFKGDDDHFQLPGLGATPPAAMQVDYAGGGTAQLATIWARVASGAYKQ